jgi:hypothetical protein
MALSLANAAGLPERLRPEVMSVREMLAVGNTLVPNTATLGARR